MALTKGRIDAAKFNPNKRSRKGKPVTQQIVWDGDLKGFGLRLNPSGTKTFILAYRTKTGRSRIMKLGRYGPVTPKQARERALAEISAINGGHDPLEARQNERSALTLAEFAPIYLENARTRGNPTGNRDRKPKKTWKEDERRLNTYILPAFGHRKLADVRRVDVRRLHNEIGGKHRHEANRVLALVSVVFSVAVDLGYLPENATNPASRIDQFEEPKRDRYVTVAEMPHVAAAIDAEENEYIRAAFWLYLLTGRRRSELLTLKWNDIDFERATVRLATTKSGKPYHLPLPADAVALLRSLPRMLGNAYVFAGSRPGRPLVNVAKPMRRIRARVWLAMNPDELPEIVRQAQTDVAGRSKHALKDADAIAARVLALAGEKAQADGRPLRVHDLRHTTGSWMHMSGASMPVIGAALTHTNGRTTERYVNFDSNPVREALEQLAQNIKVAANRA